MENTQFVKDCLALPKGSSLTFDSITFKELFNLKYPAQVNEDPSAMFWWNHFRIYAHTTVDVVMRVWNHKHPVEENTADHICKKGVKVRVSMISRMGDVGITDNLEKEFGYDARGVDVKTLTKWEVVKISDIPDL